MCDRPLILLRVADEPLREALSLLAGDRRLRRRRTPGRPAGGGGDHR
ncbi:hypothetical protein ACRAWD_17965 [Caulobacter segnis]